MRAKINYLLVAVCIATFAVTIGWTQQAHSSEIVLSLTWNDLVPKKGGFWKAPIDDLSQQERDALSKLELDRLILEQKQVYHSVAVVHELSGKQVSIPGLVVPLEYDGQNVKEFLLVPYHGACIHVPPPPLHQIVYVTANEGFEIEKLFDAVLVTGIMKTVLTSKQLDEVQETVDAGYRIENASVKRYTGEI